MIPKEKRLKQYLPYGVMKVVNLWLSSSRGICQKPEAVSSDEKTVELLSFAVISSDVASASLFTFTYYGPLYFAVWSPLSCTCTVAMMLRHLLNCAELLSLLVYLLRLPFLLYHHF
ncbi:hypothetical protein GOODEAATRI_009544 [Goodea atripinnis]|uniref:Uncharacterized protein n=1 Tax=Goodea atripinnis TaxID=208336 RepID=A0ABV0NT47_9TELE